MNDEPSQAITITVNGARRALRAGATIADLLRALDHPPSLFAVERNREIVPKATHGRTRLEDGDRIEIVTFVGGG